MKINKEMINSKVKKASMHLSKHTDLILETNEKESKINITMSDNVSNIIDITESISKQELRQIIIMLREFYGQMEDETDE